jgi:hypothetical protein
MVKSLKEKVQGRVQGLGFRVIRCTISGLWCMVYGLGLSPATAPGSVPKENETAAGAVAPRPQGSGGRVQGCSQGFRVQGSRFRFQGSGFRVQGLLGFRV